MFAQIEDGEIFAAINQKDGMVSFHDNPEKYNSLNMLKRLEAEVNITTKLCSRKCFCILKTNTSNVLTFSVRFLIFI